ncbi:MAG TPA: hypothetical protein VII33_16205 [Nakamurella sp.]
MSSRQQGLRRSPFESQPSGIDAWLGADGQVPEVPEVPEVPDVSDVANVSNVSNVSNVRAVPDAKKVVRIAGPKWDPDLLQQGRDAVLFLRQQAGRPTMALTEALDEAVQRWLGAMRDQYNAGEGFPPQGGLR